MSDWTETEVWYEPNTLLIGVWRPDGKGGLEFMKFNVIAYLGPIDYDVTDASQIQKSIPYFKEFFAEHLSRREMRIWA